MSIEQIKDLVNNTDKTVSSELQDQAIFVEIEKRGVDFQITDEILVTLKEIGAGTKTLNSLIKTKNTQSNSLRKKHSNNIIILVAKFGEQSDDNNVTDLIFSQLKESTKKYANVSVLAINKHISAREGKSVAIEKGKEKDADIVLWGWYKKSSTNVVINYQFEVISGLSNDFLTQKQNTSVENIPNFNNFSSQLRLAKEISFLTVVSLGAINYELENFDEAIRYISDAISQESSFNKLIDFPKLYTLRAISYLSRSCDYLTPDERILVDVNKAISLGADSNEPKILRILAASTIRRNLDKALEYAERSFKGADNAEDKTLSLILISAIYEVKENETQMKYFAKKLIDHLIVLPETFENNLNLAVAFYFSRDKVKTALYLDKAKNSAKPEHTQTYRIYNLQGFLYRLDENYDLAVENFIKSIQLKPTCVSTYIILADTYKEKGDNNLALNTYNQALEINSDIPEIYINKGAVYEKTDDFDRALANFQKAVEVDPNSVEAYHALANYFKSKNKPDEAITNFSKLLAVKADDTEALEERAKLYLEKEKFDIAVVDYRKLLPLKAKDTTELGKLLVKSFFREISYEFLKREKHEIGLEFSDKYIQLFPKDDLGYEYRATFLEKQDKIDQAINSLSQAIRLKTDNAPFYQKRAMLLNKRGNFDKALEDIDQAIRLKPNEDSYYEARSNIYEKIGNIELAIKSLEKAIEVSKTSLYKSIFQRKLDSLKEKLKTSNDKSNK